MAEPSAPIQQRPSQPTQHQSPIAEETADEAELAEASVQASEDGREAAATVKGAMKNDDVLHATSAGNRSCGLSCCILV